MLTIVQMSCHSEPDVFPLGSQCLFRVFCSYMLSRRGLLPLFKAQIGRDPLLFLVSLVNMLSLINTVVVWRTSISLQHLNPCSPAGGEDWGVTLLKKISHLGWVWGFKGLCLLLVDWDWALSCCSSFPPPSLCSAITNCSQINFVS